MLKIVYLSTPTPSRLLDAYNKVYLDVVREVAKTAKYTGTLVIVGDGQGNPLKLDPDEYARMHGIEI